MRPLVALPLLVLFGAGLVWAVGGFSGGSGPEGPTVEPEPGGAGPRDGTGRPPTVEGAGGATTPAAGSARAPQAREALFDASETFPAPSAMDPMARFMPLERQQTPGQIAVTGRDLVDAIVAGGWLYVRYEGIEARDALLAATFELRAVPRPAHPEQVAVELSEIVSALKARGFRVAARRPVLTVGLPPKDQPPPR